jgi:hypothetical protein
MANRAKLGDSVAGTESGPTSRVASRQLFDQEGSGVASFTYGEWRFLWLGVMAAVCAVGAASAGEGAATVLMLLGVSEIIFFLAWRRAKQ